MKLLVIIFLNLVLLGFRADAATYAVKAGGGGDFTNVQACANAAVAGDTCTVFAGTYSGWTQPTSGSAGKPITFQANPGDTVTLTGSAVVSGRGYITVSGLRFSGTQAITGMDTNPANHIVFRKNVVVGNGTAHAVYLYGDSNLIEGNDLSHNADFNEIGGKNVVVRNNYWHDVNAGAQGTSEHIDGIQVMGGGTNPTLSFSLVEGNVERNCTNDSGNCHFIIVRTGSGPVADTVIVRYNYAQNLDGSGASFGGLGDDVPHPWFYNNTIATERLTSESGDCASFQNAPYSGSFNNICYNTGAPGLFGIGGCIVSGLSGFCNGNIEFSTGYSGSWGLPYSGEATYIALHNQNPLFANYPTNGTLQAGSHAIGAGVALTTASGSGSNSTSLTVADAHGFQPGWAGVQPDWIRIGASTTVQIAAVNYTNNVIALASPVTWTSGAPIFLYKDSDGTVVLNGANPDIGAYPAGSGGSGGGTQAPAAPTGLTAVVS